MAVRIQPTKAQRDREIDNAPEIVIRANFAWGLMGHPEATDEVIEDIADFLDVSFTAVNAVNRYGRLTLGWDHPEVIVRYGETIAAARRDAQYKAAYQAQIAEAA